MKEIQDKLRILERMTHEPETAGRKAAQCA